MRRLRIICWLEFGTHYNIIHQIYQNNLPIASVINLTHEFLSFENLNCLAKYVGFMWGIFPFWFTGYISVGTTA